MRITGARIALAADQSLRRDLWIRTGRISFSGPERESALNLDGFLLLPGLINAHDHLEFNLFPKLGAGPYANAKDWAEDVYRPYDSPVREQLLLPKRTRLLWGGIKNLLSGVTTVAHHNPVEDANIGPDFPVNVVNRFGWAHSLDFAGDIGDRFRATPPDWPFVIHAAEGVDERARGEIARLDRLGILSERTVLVHAIGMDHPGLTLLQTRRTGIVWCPTSNLGVYGRTLGSEVLESGVDIALGTDSAMTAQTDLIEETSVARRVSSLGAAALYVMVTERAARLLRLSEGQGTIREGGAADLIAVEDRGQTPAGALANMQLEMVMVRGAIRLAGRAVMERIGAQGALRHPVTLDGRGSWFTDVDLPSLHAETVRVLGRDFKLAGRRVSP